MANDVTNNLYFQGDENEIKQMLESIQDDYYGLGSITFKKIIPEPEDIEERPSDGVFPFWRTWRIQNWGTKWDAYGFQPNANFSQGDCLSFFTAWDSPHMVIDRLAELFPNITMLHEWADEDFGANCGYMRYENGNCVDTYFPETQKEAYILAAKVMNYELDEIGLRPNSTGTNYIWSDLEDYNLANLFNRPALFCEERISEDDIPEGMYLYQLRHPSEEIYTLEKTGVEFDFAGSIITDYDIDFFDSQYLLLNNSNFRVMDDIGYLSFDNYLKRDFDFDQPSQDFGGM